jgi:peptidyl-prolyl cis-trans isomerase A (cyclophilin A)
MAPRAGSRSGAALGVAVLVAIAACRPPAGPAAAAVEAAPARVLLATELGDVELEIDRARAPRTSANFLRHVERGRYDGGRFHRTVRADNQPASPVKIEVVQAGIDPEREGESLAPVALERTSVTGLAHRDGTVSMARAGPDTATSDFFICGGDQPELDFGGRRNPDGQGFAAFGRVVRGMDVVRRIQAAPALEQTLTPPVRILRARRLEGDTGAGERRPEP